jgi:hypothetical protein
MSSTAMKAAPLAIGATVKFVSRSLMESLKFTKIAAVLPAVHVSDKRGKQVRYIIEHLHGWVPSNQPELRANFPEVFESLKPERYPPKYYAFAYADELTLLSEEEFKALKNVQGTKKH